MSTITSDKALNENLPAKRKSRVDLYRLIQVNNRKYDKDVVIEAAKAYIITGSFARVAEMVGVDRTTVRNWASKEWWDELIEECKYLKNIELDGQYTRILDKSLEELWDRLENGDEHVLKDGTKTRKRVGARDAALIAAIIFDKRQLLRGEATQKVEHNFSVDDRLAKLQETFDQIARRASEKVIEAEIQEDVRTINSLVHAGEFSRVDP